MRAAVGWTVERLGRLKQRVAALAATIADLPVTVAARIHAAAASAVRRPTRAATPARWWARRGVWILAGAAAVVAVSASEAAANHAGATNPKDPLDGCPLPGGMKHHCKSPRDLLPMWRWTRVSYIWSDWSGGGYIEKHFKAAVGAAYDMIVRIMFIVATLVWEILSRLLYMALQADFADHLADAINATYYQVARALFDSGAIWVVLLIGYGSAAWKMFREGIAESIKTVAWSVLSISLLLVMLFALGSSGGSLDPVGRDPLTGQDVDIDGDLESEAFTQRGAGDDPNKDPLTPRWLYERTKSLSDLASNMLVDVSLELSKNNVAHGSYCSVYTHQLERLYLLAAQHRAEDGKLEAKHYPPIFLSRLWERAYLGPWSQAQYGSPQNAYNGSCLWAETNAVPAPEIMAVWTVSCDADGDDRSDYLKGVAASTEVLNLGTNSETPLYGCPGTLGGIPGIAKKLPIVSAGSKGYSDRDQDRAWRVFHPNGDDETLTFLNLASGCGLAAHGSLKSHTEDGGDPDGAPEFTTIPKPYLNIHNGDKVDLLTRSPSGYVQARRVGMRPEKADKKGKWFSFDACRVWITGAEVPESTIDTSVHGKNQRGIYEHRRSRLHAPQQASIKGLNSQYPEGSGQDHLRRR